jgi:hypothetical protein
MTAFFSIVSVTKNDAWSLTKTSRSVFRQSFRDFEYLIVDGASSDGTQGLTEFWKSNGLVSQSVSELDSGVYSAMNKGLRLATGAFVCFLNAGDVFASDGILAKVHRLLGENSLDGVLGWGELNGQIWGSWIESDAFKLSSLGFCHQALFVRRSLLLQQPFDERPFKTDSDTLQLGRLYGSGAHIAIVPEVFAVRGGEPGISADIERTKASILSTLLEEYPPLTTDLAQLILAFRRQCVEPKRLHALMEESSDPLRSHLAYMVLDTLFLRQSSSLSESDSEALFDCARSALARSSPRSAVEAIDRLLVAQRVRRDLMAQRATDATKLQADIATFQSQETARLGKLRPSQGAQRSETSHVVVSLTSFPARIPTLHFVIRSLIEQSCRPREIHVWLGTDEIPNRKWLPRALLELESHGLQIHFARKTFHQYDKFLHNSDLNRDTSFVIVDDDVIYPPEALASLISAHKEHPSAVIANRCHLMSLRPDGRIAPYREWIQEVRVAAPSLRAFPTGAGGVLYPPGFMCEPLVTNIRDILARAPYADDVWLKTCALARGIPSMTTSLSQASDWYLRYTTTMRAGALHATNVDRGLNDMQIERCTEWLSQVRSTWRDELLADEAA